MRGRRPAAWHTGTVVEAAPETPTARRITIERPKYAGSRTPNASALLASSTATNAFGTTSAVRAYQ